jgi:hypothetical protein
MMFGGEEIGRASYACRSQSRNFAPGKGLNGGNSSAVVEKLPKRQR